MKTFTQNWTDLTAIEYRTIEQEHEQINTEFIWEGEDANKWYFCVRAVDEFHQKNGRVANSEDQEEIRGLVDGYLEKYGIDKDQFSVEDKFIEEMYDFYFIKFLTINFYFPKENNFFC